MVVETSHPSLATRSTPVGDKGDGRAEEVRADSVCSVPDRSRRFATRSITPKLLFQGVRIEVAHGPRPARCLPYGC